MISIYSAEADRTVEMAVRSLGLRRCNILGDFLMESPLFGLVGGCIGLFFASLLQFFTISTLNFQTVSELAFSFELTFEIFYKSLIFSLVMGFVGGVLPAFRASRKNIVEALRVT